MTTEIIIDPPAAAPARRLVLSLVWRKGVGALGIGGRSLPVFDPTAGANGGTGPASCLGKKQLAPTDPQTSGRHLELRRSAAGIELRDVGSSNGTFVNAERLSTRRQPSAWVTLVIGDVVRVARGAILVAHLSAPESGGRGLNSATRAILWAACPGVGWAAHRVRSWLAEVALCKAHVLISGATGSGKQRVAEAIAALTHRGQAPVAANAKLLTGHPGMVALFGVAKGYEGGARPGLLEAVGDGVLFLDEIQELDPGMAGALLTVFETPSTFSRFGEANGRRPFAGRLVAATSTGFDSLATRLTDAFVNRFTMRLVFPSLHERPEDVPLLLHLVLQQVELTGSAPVLEAGQVAAEDVEAMARGTWAGANVRGLKSVATHLALRHARGEAPRLNAADRAIIGAGGGSVAAQPTVAQPTLAQPTPAQPSIQPFRLLDSVARLRALQGALPAHLRGTATDLKAALALLLRAQNGTVARACKALGVSTNSKASLAKWCGYTSVEGWQAASERLDL